MARRSAPRKGGGRGPCSVEGCKNDAARSLSRRKVADALSESTVAEGRRAYLCKDHYKEYKKATKVDRTVDRLTW